MAQATPARLGVGRAGTRYTTAALLQFRADQARAVDAVQSELPADWAQRHGMVEVKSRASTRDEYLRLPEMGRMLDASDAARLRRLIPRARSGVAQPTILICVGDGLSCAAVERHAPALVKRVSAQLISRYRLLPPLFVRNARVRIQDHIGEILRPDAVVMIIGERPGLATAESLSAYIIWRPRLSSQEPDRTVISNIHPGGIRVASAAAKIAEVIEKAVLYRVSGAELAVKLAAESPRLATRRRKQ